jgi:hypothetical protein
LPLTQYFKRLALGFLTQQIILSLLAAAAEVMYTAAAGVRGDY